MLSRFAAELGTAAATALAGLVVILGATEYGIGWGSAGPEPGAFPFYMGVLIVLGSLGTIGQTVLARSALQMPVLDGERALRVLSFFGPVVLFVLAAVFLGLYVATALYLFAVMWLQGGYRPWTALATGIAVSVFFFFVLEQWFRVPLSKGPLEAALGIY